MPQPILSATKICKSYPSGNSKIEVLRGLDLEVSRGESISVRGESGSGKSTLLNILAGLEHADSGTLHWDASPSIDVARRAGLIGIVFQSFYLIPEIDTCANVLMARRVIGPIRSEDKDRARELLARVGIAERGHHLPSELSGGERQRVAVARALMNRPKLILADEPTGNLDEHTGDSVIDLLLNLCSETETALVLVTHNPTHASRVHRAFSLHEGLLFT